MIRNQGGQVGKVLAGREWDMTTVLERVLA